MNGLSVYVIIMALCSLVIVSYIYSILSERSRVPTVLLLLATGMGLRWLTNQLGWQVVIPDLAIELVGALGLIMIVLEAGLDLKFSKEKLRLIANALYSSLFVLILSVIGVAFVIHEWLDEAWLNSIVYAIPLSVISSAIVIPSSKNLNEIKREFLAYESSFSDILGILVFDYFVSRQLFTPASVAALGGGVAFALGISFVFSVFLLWVLTRTKISIKYFLLFASLLFLYSAGRLLHLPSLIIILVFGLLINNWDKVRHVRAKKIVRKSHVSEVLEPLKSLTAESSFLIRTFFFVLFGFTIQVGSIFNSTVIIVGSIVVALLYAVRYLYLRIFMRMHIFPELFYAPRGLVTILLFYKIPEALQLASFNDGILFFVILVTSLVMMIGSIFFTPKEAEEEQSTQSYGMTESNHQV